jgi:hypothetical protein
MYFNRFVIGDQIATVVVNETPTASPLQPFKTILDLNQFS